MKKTLAAATVAALVGVVGAANAADLYKGGGMKDVPVIAPPPTWTGFYIGAHVGGAWRDDNMKFCDGPGSTCYYGDGYAGNGYYNWNNNNDGAIFGGGTLGYNWQGGNFLTGGLVLGFEADFGAVGNTNNNDRYLYTNYWRSNEDTSFYADVTGRIGIAWGPTMIYAKGGWAYLDNPLALNFDGGSRVYGFCGAYTCNWKGDSLDGWTVGGGIEYLWSPNWSVKAEYLFFDFGNNDHTWTYVDGAGLSRYAQVHDDLTVNTFKVGLNYHFGGYSPAPLK